MADADEGVADRIAADVVDGMDDARDMSALESAKVSLSNYRNMVGMTLGVAVAVDLLFIVLGLSAAAQTTGILYWGGLGLAGIGGAGLLEKVLRRVVG